jgi:hypothetical protein
LGGGSFTGGFRGSLGGSLTGGSAGGGGGSGGFSGSLTGGFLGQLGGSLTGGLSWSLIRVAELPLSSNAIISNVSPIFRIFKVFCGKRLGAACHF